MLEPLIPATAPTAVVEAGACLSNADRTGLSTCNAAQQLEGSEPCMHHLRGSGRQLAQSALNPSELPILEGNSSMAAEESWSVSFAGVQHPSCFSLVGICAHASYVRRHARGWLYNCAQYEREVQCLTRGRDTSLIQHKAAQQNEKEPPNM